MLDPLDRKRSQTDADCMLCCWRLNSDWSRKIRFARHNSYGAAFRKVDITKIVRSSVQLT